MKNILLVCHCVPYPPDKGERLRAFHIVNVLGRYFNVSLLCFSREHEKHDLSILRQYCRRIKVVKVSRFGGFARGAIRLLKGGSLTQGFYDLKKAHKIIHRWGYFDVAMGYSVQMFRYIKNANCAARIIDLVDVDSLKWKQYSKTSSGIMSWLYRREFWAIRTIERLAISLFDASVLVSQAEALKAPIQNEKLLAIQNGVDNKYFYQASSTGHHKYSIIFIGTMNYLPNIQAVLWFVQNVWPAVKKKYPSSVFQIVGRNPSRAVKKLRNIDGITVTGAVKDVRPYLEDAYIAIAPLMIARGVQNKILESMAMGVPTIGSPQATEGLDLIAGEEIIEAQTDNQWQSAILELFGDAKLHDQIGSAGRRAVTQKYNWNNSEAKYSRLINDILHATKKSRVIPKPRVGQQGFNTVRGVKR